MRIQKFEKQKKTRGVYANENLREKGALPQLPTACTHFGCACFHASMNSVSFRVTKLSWIRHFRWQLHYKRMHSSRIRTNRYRCQYWRSLFGGGSVWRGVSVWRGSLSREGGLPTPLPPVDRQMLLKTLPSLAVGKCIRSIAILENVMFRTNFMLRSVKRQRGRWVMKRSNHGVTWVIPLFLPNVMIR